MKKTGLVILLVIFSTACNTNKPNQDEANGASNLSQKELMYWSNGKNLYTTFCSNCHTEEGIGMGRLIPPLKNADYLMIDLGRSARIIKYGQSGPLTVNGVDFNQPMPANPKLTNLEIAELITFISNSWGNEAKGVTIDEIEDALKKEEIN